MMSEQSPDQELPDAAYVLGMGQLNPEDRRAAQVLLQKLRLLGLVVLYQAPETSTTAEMPGFITRSSLEATAQSLPRYKTANIASIQAARLLNIVARTFANPDLADEWQASGLQISFIPSDQFPSSPELADTVLITEESIQRALDNGTLTEIPEFGVGAVELFRAHMERVTQQGRGGEPT